MGRNAGAAGSRVFRGFERGRYSKTSRRVVLNDERRRRTARVHGSSYLMPIHPYALAIAILLVLLNALELLASVLNIRALSSSLPEEFRGIYDENDYRRSQEYAAASARFGWVTLVFDLAVLLAFWAAGGFEWVDERWRQVGWGPVWTGVGYLGTLMGARALLDLPFSLYGTFVIEERFGFNRTTVRTFFADRLKGLGLSIVLGAPLLAGVLFFFETGGENAWLSAWAFVSLITVTLAFVAPIWIMPLFNKMTPLETGPLREQILAYAQTVAYPLTNVFVVDGSKRSTKSNAFFTGFGRNKRVALYDTLIENHSVEELVAVHYCNNTK